MSCKYCELKHRKDDDVEWVAGEDWESDSDDGGYICPNDDGFRMLVYYDARYACTAVENIKYCPFCGAKLAMPKEPLIKDEKVRKAVKAWAEANGAWLLLVVSSYRIEIRQVDAEILFNDPVFEELPRDRQLTITELCG